MWEKHSNHQYVFEVIHIKTRLTGWLSYQAYDDNGYRIIIIAIGYLDSTYDALSMDCCLVGCVQQLDEYWAVHQ